MATNSPFPPGWENRPGLTGRELAIGRMAVRTLPEVEHLLDRLSGLPLPHRFLILTVDGELRGTASEEQAAAYIQGDCLVIDLHSSQWVDADGQWQPIQEVTNG